MVDFVKLVIPSQDIPRIEQNPLLEFKSDFNKATAEIGTKSIAIYKGLKFILWKNYAEVQGSLHPWVNLSGPDYDYGQGPDPNRPK